MNRRREWKGREGLTDKAWAGRGKSGQAIAETAAILPILVLLILFGTGVLFYVGSRLYYAQKLSFIAQQGAQVALGNISWGGRTRDSYNPTTLQPQVQAALAPMLNAMGLHQVQIDVQPVPPNAPQYVTVTATANGLSIFSAGFAPRMLTISESATAVQANQTPDVVLCMANLSLNRVMYFPGYYFGPNNAYQNSGPLGTFGCAGFTLPSSAPIAGGTYTETSSGARPSFTYP